MVHLTSKISGWALERFYNSNTTAFLKSVNLSQIDPNILNSKRDPIFGFHLFTATSCPVGFKFHLERYDQLSPIKSLVYLSHDKLSTKVAAVFRTWIYIEYFVHESIDEK